MPPSTSVGEYSKPMSAVNLPGSLNSWAIFWISCQGPFDASWQSTPSASQMSKRGTGRCDSRTKASRKIDMSPLRMPSQNADEYCGVLLVVDAERHDLETLGVIGDRGEVERRAQLLAGAAVQRQRLAAGELVGVARA